MTLEEVVLLVQKHPGSTCVELADRAWPDKRKSRQSYARPMGALLHRAELKRLVMSRYSRIAHTSYSRREWYAR